MKLQRKEKEGQEERGVEEVERGKERNGGAENVRWVCNRQLESIL
jgi:hypothetical protein